MKTLQTLAIVAVLATVGTLFAQVEGGLSVPRIDTTPTEQAEKGTIYAAASENAYYFKAGGNTSTDWTKFNFAPLSGALTGTATLVAGTVNITNSSLTTNSVIWLSAKGTATNSGALNYTTPTTNGVVTISSITNAVVNTNDTREVNWLSLGN